MLKPNVTTKRLEEIEGIQDRIRKLAEEYKNDFTEPNALDAVVDRDLRTALESLDLLRNLYKSKTDRKAQ